MGRYVEVEVEAFFEEGGVKYVVVSNGDCDVQEVNLVAPWAEYPFQSMIIVDIINEIFPLFFVCLYIG